jgi:parvulin-like peptidyl-prolyl isomerase
MSTRIRPVRSPFVSFNFSAQRTHAACTLFVLFAATFSALAADRPDPPRVVEEIVAKINGDIVTRGDLTRARDMLEKEARQQGITGTQLQEILDKTSGEQLRNEIDKYLMVQKGKELDINVDAELNKEIAAIQSESKISDPDKFHDWMRQMSGMSYEDFRQKKKEELLTSRVVEEEVWRNIVIPEADAQKFYNEHKAEFVRTEAVTLRMILVSTGDGKPDTVAAAMKKANSLLTRARSGTDKFSDLARQNSDDPSAADDGLLPTPFERGQGADPKRELNKAIEDIVFNHEKGYVTDLIQIKGAGFAIYRVEEHIPAGQATFDDVKNQINSILTRPIADPKLRVFLTGLRQNAFLQIKPGYVDSGAAPGKDTTWKDPSQLLPQTTTKAQVANQRHFKKLLGVIPYGMTGVKDTAPSTPNTTPVQQTPAAANADGSPTR